MYIEEPATIKNCELIFECPKQWDELEPTANKAVRFCGTCDRGVYLAEDEDTLAMLAAAGKCVAFADSTNTLEELPLRIVGMFVPVEDAGDPGTDFRLDPK
ncbi:MAG TPA: hypothetical protein PKC65_14115 [Pyrinomonadaceae bacterium]|nr:hypothetical protein [Pyrinomonadaceae bacterium]